MRRRSGLTPMGEGRGRIFTPGFIPPDDCGFPGGRAMIRPENEDDKPVDFEPGFGYNQGRSIFCLRKSLIFFS